MTLNDLKGHRSFICCNSFDMRIFHIIDSLYTCTALQNSLLMHDLFVLLSFLCSVTFFQMDFTDYVDIFLCKKQMVG